MPQAIGIGIGPSFSRSKSAGLTYAPDMRDLTAPLAFWVPESNIESLNAEPTYGYYRPTLGAAFSSTSNYAGSGGVSQVRCPVNGHEMYDPSATGAVPLYVSDAIRNAGLQFGSVNGGGVSARLLCRNSAGSFNFIHGPVHPAFSVSFWWKPDVTTTINTICGNSNVVAPGSGTTTHDGFNVTIASGGLPRIQVVSNGVLITANIGNNAGLKAATAAHWYFFVITCTSAGLVTYYRGDYGTVASPISNPTINPLASGTTLTNAGSTADAMNPLVMGLDWSATAGTLATSTNRAQGTIANLCIFTDVLSSTAIVKLSAYNPVPDAITSGRITGTPTVLSRRLVDSTVLNPEQLSHLNRKHDPSDLTRMFKDTAGTSAVTTAGDSVKYLGDSTDSSFIKNHREAIYDTSSAAAPTYQTSGGSFIFWNGAAPDLVGGVYTDNTRADNNLIMPAWPLCDLTLIYAFQNLVVGGAGDTGQQLSHVFQTNANNYLWIAGSQYPGGTGQEAGVHYSISDGTTSTPQVPQGNAEQVHVYEIYINQGKVTFKVDGTSNGAETQVLGVSLFGGVAVNWGWDSADTHLNPLTSPSSNCNGRLRGPFCLYNTCHSEANGARVARKMCQNLGLTYNG